MNDCPDCLCRKCEHNNGDVCKIDDDTIYEYTCGEHCENELHFCGEFKETELEKLKRDMLVINNMSKDELVDAIMAIRNRLPKKP